jgi:hypothetical protein
MATVPPRPFAARRLILTLGLLALSLGPAATGPSVSAAGDSPAGFEVIATTPLSLPGDDFDVDGGTVAVTWDAGWYPTLSEGDPAVPFAPGFITAEATTLVVFRDDGSFSRVRAGDALATDGRTDLAPVARDGEPAEFLAIELLPADTSTPDDARVDVPEGEWELALWHLSIPAGSGDVVAYDLAGTPGALPALVIVVTGEAAITDAAGEATGDPLTADDPARLVTGPFGIAAAQGDDLAVLVASITEPGTASPNPSSSIGTDRDGAGTPGRTTPARPSGPASPAASALPPGASAPSASVAPSPSTEPGTDTDGDGLSDSDEATRGTNPSVADTDTDGLDDGEEVLYLATDPLDRFTDGDSLTDYEEVVIHGTDPLDADTDGDTYDDGTEIFGHGSDPFSFDTDADGDGLLTSAEARSGTDASNPDTDGDCLNDFVELTTLGALSPLTPDTDADGQSDLIEYTGDPNATCP